MALLALLLLPLLPFAVLGYAVLGEPYRPVFKRHRLPLPGVVADRHVDPAHQRSARPPRRPAPAAGAEGRAAGPRPRFAVRHRRRVREGRGHSAGGRHPADGQSATRHLRGAGQSRAQRARCPVALREQARRGWRRADQRADEPRRAACAAATATTRATPWPTRCASAGITVLHNEGVRVSKRRPDAVDRRLRLSLGRARRHARRDARPAIRRGVPGADPRARPGLRGRKRAAPT